MVPFMKIDSKGRTDSTATYSDSKVPRVPSEVIFVGVVLFAVLGFLALLLGTTDVFDRLDLAQKNDSVTPSSDQD
jgi:hypothetical protein